MTQTMEPKQSSKHEDDSVSLPEDVIFDVLVRLPVKALCRFRCVSKAWQALISEPAFITAHSSRAGRLIVGMFESGWRYELQVLDMLGNVLMVFNVDSTCTCVAQTCLDLIFVNRRSQGAMIINPAAQRAFAIGRHTYAERNQWNNYSFGRATQSGAYKVLRLSETHPTVCEVATITDYGGEPTWRQRPTPDLFNGFSNVHKATVNGVLYFMASYFHKSAPGWNRIAAFDLETEVWLDTINGPPLEEQGDWWISLTDLKETLCMVHNIRRTDGHVLCSDIWRLIDRNKGLWIRTHTIPQPTECRYTEVLDVLDDDKILLLKRICSPFVLQLFNPRTKVFTDIMQMAEEFYRMTFFSGSLLSS